MTEKRVDLETWPRRGQYAWFRQYDRPHYATTTRMDVTGLMTRAKPEGVSVYRASLHAIATGLEAVPELKMRFRGDQVVQHDKLRVSFTVPNVGGAFSYAYVAYEPDFTLFDAAAAAEIAQAAARVDLSPNDGACDDLAYLSCMPWIDYTSLNNAMPHKDDCIPRVSWGKIVQEGDQWRMAMTLEVHHALVDGEQVGAYFTAVQAAFARFAQT